MKKTFVYGLFLVLSISVKAQEMAPGLKIIKNAMMNENHKEALEESKKMIEAGGDSVSLSMANSYAGISSQELGNLQEAVAYYKNAILYKVPRLDIYEMMMGLTKKIGDNTNYEFAVLEYRAAFPELEKDAERKLATHYHGTKQYEKLLPTCDKLIGWFPDVFIYQYYKAVAYQNLKDIAKAELAYKKALELNPDHYNSNVGLGMILYKKGSASFKSKKKKYESLKSPTRLDYDKYRKSLESSKMMYSNALKYLLRAYQIKPNDKLKPVLSNIYTRLDKKSEAAKYQ